MLEGRQMTFVAEASDIDSAPIPVQLKTVQTDINHLVAESLSIAEVRKLVEKSARRPLSSPQQVFVIGVKQITVEAQNALLKLFEEPPKDTSFYLVIPSLSLLLPTLKSRLLLVSREQSEFNLTDAKEFCALSYKDRLDLVAQKVKAKDNDWTMSVVLGAGKLFLCDPKQNHEALQSLALVESYIKIRGAAKKQLLEELALSLPLR